MLNTSTLQASWQHWWNWDAPRVGPRWLLWLWSALYAMVVAAAFTVLGFALFASGNGAWRNWQGWVEWYGRNLVVSVIITVVIQALLHGARRLIGRERLRRWPRWQRSVFFTVLPLLGVLIGWAAGVALLGGNLLKLLDLDANSLAATLLLGLLVSAVFSLVWMSRTAAIAARMQATEAKLQLLQAQIEPHFLFNTLANVLSLIDHDAPRAKQMLESFIDYLRGALGQLRDEHTTVGAELALAEAYLMLMAQRMPDRLRYRIEAAPELRSLPLPPLLLQPLVENAIRHGLEPKIEGGTVTVRAAQVDGRLQLTVHDDGLGLDAPRRPGPRGAGIALANIRERLATRYSGLATLTLQTANPGTLATLTLPLPRP